jgi:HEAT repeat protein
VRRAWGKCSVFSFQCSVFIYRRVKRGRRVIGIALTCAAVGVAAFLIWPREREPVYHGKRLSEWVGQLDPKFPGLPPEAALAVETCGTNGLPFLLKAIAHGQRPRNPYAFYYALTKVPVRIGMKWWSYNERHWRLGMQAAAAFSLLGARANSAIPELCRMGSDPEDPAVASLATIALGGIGPDALSALVALATNKQASIMARSQAACEIGHRRGLSSQVKVVTPALVACLNETDATLVETALESLADVGAGNETVVPWLTKAMHHQDPDVRYLAVAALGSFWQRAAREVPDLAKLLNDQSAEVRSAATNALQEIAAEALNGLTR